MSISVDALSSSRNIIASAPQSCAPAGGYARMNQYSMGNAGYSHRPAHHMQGRVYSSHPQSHAMQPFARQARVKATSYCKIPTQRAARTARMTLAIDLDETLVHSSFDPMKADLHINVALDGEQHVAYVKKRPYSDLFLARCVELFDVVIWTASLAVYAEPLVAELCKSAKCGSVKQMYRDSCTQLPGGGYVKDLSVMGRSLDDVCILDNSPAVAQLQPDNLIPIVSWYDDVRDTCLRDLLPQLERLAVNPSAPVGILQMPHVRMVKSMHQRSLAGAFWR